MRRFWQWVWRLILPDSALRIGHGWYGHVWHVAAFPSGVAFSAEQVERAYMEGLDNEQHHMIAVTFGAQKRDASSWPSDEKRREFIEYIDGKIRRRRRE